MKIQSPTHEQIAARAYQIFLERGAQHGHDRDDWLQAEYELMQLPVRKLAEMPGPQKLKRRDAKPSIIDVVRDAMFMSRLAPSAGAAAGF